MKYLCVWNVRVFFFCKLQQNPFADDEAEEDDDEAGDGENLKLHWSDDDDDNDENEAETKSKTADEDDEGTLNMINRINRNFTVFELICV